jgi:predicted hydrocarbon binding protein
MTSEIRVPSSILRLLCDSVIDNLGEKSLRLLFTQAGLQPYYSGGPLPPPDDTPSLTLDELNRLFATAFNVFGERGVRPILLRAGRGVAQHFRETNRTLATLAGAAFRVLPADAKIKLVLRRAANIGEESLHMPHQTYDTPEGYFVEIRDSLYAKGIAAQRPVCYFPVGFYGEIVRWATGTNHAVEEVECIAASGQVCRFRVARQPAATGPEAAG